MIIIVALINAAIDFSIISKGLKVNHTLEAVIRGIIIMGLSLLHDNWISSFIVNCSVFWIVFELALNSLRKLPLLYVGETSFIDKLARVIFPTNTGFNLLIIKFIALCVGLYFSTS